MFSSYYAIKILELLKDNNDMDIEIYDFVEF